MSKFSKVSYLVAFIGAFGSGILNIQYGWNSYVWPFIAAVWIANSYILESKTEEVL